MTPDEKDRLDSWIASCEGKQDFKGIQSQILLMDDISRPFLKGVFDCFPKSEELLNQFSKLAFDDIPEANGAFTEHMIEPLLTHIRNDLIEKTKAEEYFEDDELLKFLKSFELVFVPDPHVVDSLPFHEKYLAFADAVGQYMRDHWISKEPKYYELYEALNSYVVRDYDNTWLLMSPLIVDSEIDFSHYSKFSDMGGIYAFTDTQVLVSSWLIAL